MGKASEASPCAVCGKRKRTVQLMPSRSQLVFGGFPHKYEYRCQSCETKLAKKIERSLTPARQQTPGACSCPEAMTDAELKDRLLLDIGKEPGPSPADREPDCGITKEQCQALERLASAIMTACGNGDCGHVLCYRSEAAAIRGVTRQSDREPRGEQTPGEMTTAAFLVRSLCDRYGVRAERDACDAMLREHERLGKDNAELRQICCRLSQYIDSLKAKVAALEAELYEARFGQKGRQ